MRHSLPQVPQFYVTAPQLCPYLDGRRERKLFTALGGEGAAALNDLLSLQGFRRSQNVLYRPACADCRGCLSARIRVESFRPSRSQRRCAARNGDLARTVSAPRATREQYELFHRYLVDRHADGGMADMSLVEYAAMVEETPVPTVLIEYRDQSGSLLACALTDRLSTGLSMVYSFYEPAATRRSLGTWMILDHIALAAELGLPFVYLGYWVPGSPKMDYKARFAALEIYKDGRWQPLGDPGAHEAETHPLDIEPIARQVAQLQLPGILSPGAGSPSRNVPEAE